MSEVGGATRATGQAFRGKQQPHALGKTARQVAEAALPLPWSARPPAPARRPPLCWRWGSSQGWAAHSGGALCKCPEPTQCRPPARHPQWDHLLPLPCRCPPLPPPKSSPTRPSPRPPRAPPSAFASCPCCVRAHAQSHLLSRAAGAAKNPSGRAAAQHSAQLVHPIAAPGRQAPPNSGAGGMQAHHKQAAAAAAAAALSLRCPHAVHAVLRLASCPRRCGGPRAICCCWLPRHHARGGVAGRGFIAYMYFCFFSAGFRICKQQGGQAGTGRKLLRGGGSMLAVWWQGYTTRRPVTAFAAPPPAGLAPGTALAQPHCTEMPRQEPCPSPNITQRQSPAPGPLPWRPPSMPPSMPLSRCHPACPRPRPLTWNEHMSVSSTLIMAPALSNSPQ